VLYRRNRYVNNLDWPTLNPILCGLFSISTIKTQHNRFDEA